MRFTRAYVQSPICGPSRMSFYTGRYMRSHGSNWNGFPLPVGEPTLGDHVQELGVRNVRVGKTHMAADSEGMGRLGIDPASAKGVYLAQCGFEPYERDDGVHPSSDPREFHDRGADPRCAGESARLREALLEWALRDHNRITTPNRVIGDYADGRQFKSGILIGYWDEEELAAARAQSAPDRV